MSWTYLKTKVKNVRVALGSIQYKGLQVEPDQSGIDKDGFELVHLAEMKYNRFIMYPSNILHMAVDEESWFEEDLHRLIQVFYLT